VSLVAVEMPFAKVFASGATRKFILVHSHTKVKIRVSIPRIKLLTSQDISLGMTQNLRIATALVESMSTVI
jgi:hypothetical protein